MKCLKRNQIQFYYANPLREEAVRDGDYITGDMNVVYDTPVECYGNVAPPSGNVFVELFGADVRYDRVIVLDDASTPITEGTVLCIDSAPSYDGEDLIYDYIVRKVARSLNSVSIAVSKVNIR